MIEFIYYSYFNAISFWEWFHFSYLFFWSSIMVAANIPLGISLDRKYLLELIVEWLLMPDLGVQGYMYLLGNLWDVNYFVLF